MNSNKNGRLEPKKKKSCMSILKISLSMAVMVFAFNMDPDTSFFEFVKPAEAAALTSITVIPASNVVNERAIYEIIFKTATTGTIKTIHMTFPSGFDVSAATKLIERNGIGSGSLSAPSSTTLIYTVSSPVSVPAGTTIRLEIGRIVNSATVGNFKVTISTENPTSIIIDGPTQTSSFPIKDITGNDVSTGFMIRKTLVDDIIGNAQGWNPNGVLKSFSITDSDFSGSEDTAFVDMFTTKSGVDKCQVSGSSPENNFFGVVCEIPPVNTAKLQYLITKLPAHVVGGIITSSSAPSFASSQDIGSISTQDETASEFP